ncbi:hypothetical protein H9623_13045 [Oerskovia sp. Sa1BUA8]|uniref:Recombinase RecT n=1 Tax=Oerskovia douganii TaxID=2762210 RepID=A0A9D5U9X4_9CELL|nr:hypothetical protein [Oerskovia douganii]MBE7701223.1 hypothetical protein [Oerskovia douganii]
MTDLTVHQPGAPAALNDKIRYAQALSGSNLLPKQYREQPANLLFALEYADALGVAPINAITSIHVIEGKPSASADLIASLVRRAGHRLRVSGDDTFAEATILRADDPDYPFTVRWDMAKARQAGLTGKGVWKAYPSAMLRSRAITEVARMAAPDALFGVIYTPEELGAEVDAAGDVVQSVSTPGRQVSAPVADRSGMARLRAAVHVEEPVAPVAPAAPVDVVDAEVMASPEQRNAVIVALAADGVPEDPASILAALSERVGREISHTRDLTADEAEQILLALGGEG